ncbi:MAG: YggS family pyridoxal phosphate-dependent enzyme [Anaerolineae bacterium]
MKHDKRIRQNLASIRDRIAEAALSAGRHPSEVQLVAVSKYFPIEAVMAARAYGQRDFGESRPEEGAEKIPQIAQALQNDDLIWHMIGHVQSRKTDMVVEHFDWVHSLDRYKFARKMSPRAVEAGRKIPVLIECNVSGEASKYGYQLAGWEESEEVREHFFKQVEALVDMPGMRIEGLMTMAPLTDDPETVRPVFASLRALREVLRERFPRLSWRHLSMGMTDDFEVAVEEGSTLVRIGRGVFGEYGSWDLKDEG